MLVHFQECGLEEDGPRSSAVRTCEFMSSDEIDLPFHTDVMEEDCLKKVRIEMDREVAIDLPSLL